MLDHRRRAKHLDRLEDSATPRARTIGRVTRALLGVAALGAVLFLYLVEPAAGVTPGCPTRSLTGVPCPGCGSLRAIHNLLHLRVGRALSLNALTVVFALGLPLAILGRARVDAFKRARPLAYAHVVRGAVAAVFIYWAARLVVGAEV